MTAAEIRGSGRGCAFRDHAAELRARTCTSAGRRRDEPSSHGPDRRVRDAELLSCRLQLDRRNAATASFVGLAVTVRAFLAPVSIGFSLTTVFVPQCADSRCGRVWRPTASGEGSEEGLSFESCMSSRSLSRGYCRYRLPQRAPSVCSEFSDESKPCSLSPSYSHSTGPRREPEHVVMLAGLATVDRSHLEAATLDGARWSANRGEDRRTAGDCLHRLCRLPQP